ncbi:MAG: RNA 2'-phosphotransferase [Gracilibacteraceae bacterium]|nr:RNA 2'-phosphotransferase [Gracilibacteraceae bacterium]
MAQDRNDIRLGRFISLVLRHNPSAAGIILDQNGWADVSELLAGMNKRGRHIDMETLERIVCENNKQRYCFDETHSKIRANQGHSLDVDVQIRSCPPPAVLYHGTTKQFLESIQEQGLVRKKRQHVHLSADVETALSVGRRHGCPVVLRIAAAAMAQDGFTFWLSENGVWLCECVPREYLVVMD